MNKEIFIKSYEKHKDNRLVSFIFYNFTCESKSKYKKYVDYFFISLLSSIFILFILGFVGLFIKILILIFFITFCSSICLFFYSFFMKTRNINKICDELKISMYEYNKYLLLYGI